MEEEADRGSDVGLPASSSSQRNQFSSAIHFIGPRDNRYWNAYHIWGGPRVIHRR